MTITRVTTLLARSPASRTLNSWLERSRLRRELRRLPAAVLDDIGLNRGDAWREAGKPFWRP